MLQLQFPSAPGAPMKRFSGSASSIWWMMCGSVATISVFAVIASLILGFLIALFLKETAPRKVEAMPQTG